MLNADGSRRVWRNWWVGVGLRFPVGRDSGQVVHTHLPLSPSIIIWHQKKTALGVNRHTMRDALVSQCKLVSGWGLQKRKSAPPDGPMSSMSHVGYRLLNLELGKYEKIWKKDNDTEDRSRWYMGSVSILLLINLSISMMFFQFKQNV